MLICLGMAFIQASHITEAGKSSVILKSGEDFQLSDVTAIQDAEAEQKSPESFVVWGEKENIRVQNDNLGRNYSVTVIEAYGDIRLIAEDINKLDEPDPSGCLIDEKTAEVLFGSKDVTGKEILYDKRKLVIRGILKNAEDTIITQAADESKGILNTVSLLKRNSQGSGDLESNFMSRHNIEGTILETNYLIGLGKFLSLLLPLCMVLELVLICVRGIYINRSRPVVFIVGIVLLGVIVLVFKELFALSFQFPKDMTPTKWSDFSFWQMLMEKKQEEITILLSSDKGTPVMPMITSLIATAKYSGAALVLYFIGFRKKSKLYVGGKQIVVAATLSFMAVFGMAVVLPQESGVLLGSGGIWFLITYYMVGIWLQDSVWHR